MTATTTRVGAMYFVVRHVELPGAADPVWVAVIRREGDRRPVEELGYYESSAAAEAAGWARLDELAG